MSDDINVEIIEDAVNVEVSIFNGLVTSEGGGSVVSYVAAGALGGHRIVTLNSSQQAIYGDKDTLPHVGRILGMTTGAADAGAAALIQTGGEITEPSWSWDVTKLIWLANNGLMTQTEPVSGFSCVLGFPIFPTKMFIDIREAIILI